jgi:hypothetical protein
MSLRAHQHDVLHSVSRDTQDMSVVAGEPAVHRQFTRELTARLQSILVADVADATPGGHHTDVIHIGPSGRP